LRSIWLQPRVELHQRFWTESVQAPLSIPTDLYQPSVAQHLEVARHTRLVHSHLLDQLADRPLAVADGIEDSLPCRFSDRLEDRELHCHAMEHTWSCIYA
jgi:hypothetical protein